MAADEADRLLVTRVRRGDTRAWDEFISRFEGRLLAFVESRLGNRATSEDVVQETFMGFLVSLPNYDDNTPLENFLFAIASHKLIDVLRRLGRRPTIPLMTPNSSGDVHEPPGSARAASSLVRSQEGKVAEEQVLGDCLQSLVQKWFQRKEFERLYCMELLFVLGWSNKDVAKRLEISEQAVANHKHFVIATLKEAASGSRLMDVNLREFGIFEKSL